MPLQNNTFKMFPDADVILGVAASMREQKYDLTTYLWYLMPLAERFGPGVYDVAAKSLNSRGVPTSAEALRALADDMRAEQDSGKYLARKRRHQHLMLTTTKQPD